MTLKSHSRQVGTNIECLQRGEKNPKTLPLSPWSFLPGPEFAIENDDCIFVGMVTEDVDVTELVNTIGAIGKDIEENGRVTIALIL